MDRGRKGWGYVACESTSRGFSISISTSTFISTSTSTPTSPLLYGCREGRDGRCLVHSRAGTHHCLFSREE